MFTDLGEQTKQDFPLIKQRINGRDLIYLDSAATAQRPQVVLDAEQEFLCTSYAAVSRGSHTLAAQATDLVERARIKVANFLGAGTEGQIVWTKSSTESINLLAYAATNASTLLEISRKDPVRIKAIEQGSFSFNAGEIEKFALQPGDNVVITELEHHANLVPWQQACLRSGAQIRWLPTLEDGSIDVENLQVIDENTKWVCITAASNVTGKITELEPIVKRAKTVGQNGNGALVVLDACQLAPHKPLNLSTTLVDFSAVSAHKIYGPTGLGVIYGKKNLIDSLPAFTFGGSMVEIVTMEGASFLRAPSKFEAGTLPVSQIVGFTKSIEYIEKIGWENIIEHERILGEALIETIADVPGVKILGSKSMNQRLGIASFVVEGVHPHDVGQFLDSCGIAIRTGHHCAQPAHRIFGVHVSSRASLGIYNTLEEVEAFGQALAKVRPFFGM